MKPDKNLDPTGTSWHGTTIQATAHELWEIMGESVYSCSKTKYNWFATTEDGQIFTVYDWKMGRFGERQKIEWHIGALSKEAEEKAKKEILAHLENVQQLTKYFLQEISKKI